MARKEMRTLFGRNFVKGLSVIRPKEWHLDVVREMKNVRWCEGENFGVRLSYDSDLSRMVGIFYRQF